MQSVSCHKKVAEISLKVALSTRLPNDVIYRTASVLDGQLEETDESACFPGNPQEEELLRVMVPEKRIKRPFQCYLLHSRDLSFIKAA